MFSVNSEGNLTDNGWNHRAKRSIFIGMSDRRIVLLFFIIISFLTEPLSAQKRLPVIVVCALNAENVDETTAKNVEDLIFSFLAEQKTFTMIDMRQTIESESPEKSDYICKSSLVSAQKLFTLTLTMEKQDDNHQPAEQKVVSRSYPTYNRILLESRAMIRELLEDDSTQKRDIVPESNTEPQQNQENKQYQFKPLLNLTCLSGTWHGDCGLERVVVMRTGKAIALWKNGSSMMLDLFIHNGMLIARQKGPSNPRYFGDVPETIAVQLAKTAEPIQWEMKLSDDDTMLIGIKHDISVVHNGETIVSSEKTTPPSIWTREQ